MWSIRIGKHLVRTFCFSIYCTLDSGIAAETYSKPEFIVWKFSSIRFTVKLLQKYFTNAPAQTFNLV